MDGTKFFQGRRAVYLTAFLIPFIMTQVFWAICGVYPFGDHSILTGDMNIEFVNFYAYFINSFGSSNDWSYMLAKTLGGDFPGLAAFQLHDPLLLLLFLFPGDRIAAGIELVFSLQISLAGLFASVLLNRRYRLTWMSLIFSTGYAFSSFFFGYLVLTIYFGALAILPLVLYFFLKYLDEDGGPVPFIICASLLIYLNYHMGFMMCLFLAILYISRIIADTSRVRRFLPLLISGITILLINGFFLVRIGLSLIGEKTTEGADYGFYRRFPMNQLFAGMFAGCARNDLRPLIYCGLVPFLFAVVYFLLSTVKIREKLANLFVISVVAVSMWINTLDAVWHGFNNPEGFYWRYAYYISITVLVLGYKGYIALSEDEDIQDGKKKRYIAVAALILLLYMVWLLITKNAYMDRTRFVLNMVLILVFAAISLILTGMKKLKGPAVALLLVISACEMLYSAKTAYLCLNLEADTLPVMADFKQDYNDIDDVISFIKEEDDGFYRIEKDFDRAINDPSMFDYTGMSHDSSCEKDAILDWLVNFGFCKTVYYTYYNGGSTAFVDDLFGIRYYVSKYDSIEKPYEIMPYKGKYHAYHNEQALPMAYAAPEGLKDCDISDGNTFEKQNLIASFWTKDPIYVKAGYEVSTEGAVETEKGHYVRTGDEAYIVYDIPITHEMPLYFYFYAPERQNAEVFVNEESYDAYFTVNHWNTLCAGTFSKGDVVKIRMKMNDAEITISEPCFYYEDAGALKAWSEAARKLNGSVGEISKITSSHFTFTTDGSEGNVIVSIPYEKAWIVTIDGEAAVTKPAVGMLMGIEVPAGTHTIDMKYRPEGTGAGILLSCAGIIMLVCIFAKGRVLSRKKIVEKVENI